MAASRPFEKLDWYGFAGCESWSADRPPVLRELTGRCLAVADRNGCEINFSVALDDWDATAILRLDRAFNSQEAGRRFLDDLPADLTPSGALELGFERIDGGQSNGDDLES